MCGTIVPTVPAAVEISASNIAGMFALGSGQNRGNMPRLRPRAPSNRKKHRIALLDNCLQCQRFSLCIFCMRLYAPLRGLNRPRFFVHLLHAPIDAPLQGLARPRFLVHPLHAPICTPARGWLDHVSFCIFCMRLYAHLRWLVRPRFLVHLLHALAVRGRSLVPRQPRGTLNCFPLGKGGGREFLEPYDL